MLDSVRRLFRDLAGQGDAVFVEALQGQIKTAVAGTGILLEALRDSDSANLLERMEEVEHHGDEWRRRLVVELGRALTTPIGREDLFRVSRSIDDVLDNLRDFARELTLYGPADRARYGLLVEMIRDGMQTLDDAVSSLAADLPRARRGSLEAKRCAGQIRDRYSESIAGLFEATEVTVDFLRHRELLRRLDVVGLRIGDAADALADGVMKRSP